MRTAILIVIGLVLVFAVLRTVRPPQRLLAATAVTVVWCGVVVWNFMTGLSHGYTVQQELPIHVAILVPPVGLAWWMALRR